ncbi:hypothetical protein AAMO2058_000526600 [Amorphochlora amoebiformis]
MEQRPRPRIARRGYIRVLAWWSMITSLTLAWNSRNHGKFPGTALRGSGEEHVEVLGKFTTALPPDVVQISPKTQRNAPRILACGLYKLWPNQTKSGGIAIYDVKFDEEFHNATLHLSQFLLSTAVFDLKWRPNTKTIPKSLLNPESRDNRPEPRNSRPEPRDSRPEPRDSRHDPRDSTSPISGESLVLAEGGADGGIRVYREGKRGLECVVKVKTGQAPVLSLSWHPGGRLLAASHGDHRVSLWEVHEPGDFREISGNLQEDPQDSGENSRYFPEISGVSPEFSGIRMACVGQWRAHDGTGKEVWCVTFAGECSDILLTGADDAILRAWNTTTHELLFESRSHSAGVTDIATNIHNPQIFASGSYDGQIRIFRISEGVSAGSPSVSLLCCHAVGHPIWKLKWHPTDPSLLLIAGTTGGFKVMRISGNIENLEKSPRRFQETSRDPVEISLQGEYRGHGSLAYGADWWQEWTKKGDDGDVNSPIVSCSFYDCGLHIWRIRSNQSQSLSGTKLCP